jgi:hypothetical protein
MALIYCSECNAQVSDKAINCIKCGNPLTNNSQNFSSDNTVNQVQANHEKQKSSNSLIVTGYILSFMSLLILPIVFTLAGVGVGIANISKGESGHGIAQIAISILSGIIGTTIGGAGFNL